MSDDFTGNNEFGRVPTDWQGRIEIVPNIYCIRRLSVMPFTRCVRCEAELYRLRDGEIYEFIIRFWDRGSQPPRLLCGQIKPLTQRVREALFQYLSENRQPLPISRALEPIALDLGR